MTLVPDFWIIQCEDSHTLPTGGVPYHPISYSVYDYVYMIRYVITIILLCSSNLYATDYFQVQLVREGRDFTFPIVKHSSDDRVETKINQLLQLSELQSLVRPSAKNIFDLASVDDGTIYGGKKGMISTIYSNNRRIFSVGFDESSCGMTCGYWHRYYNFNSANGDRLELRDLFTPKGFEEFSKKIVEKRSRKYRQEVRRKVESEYRENFLGTIGCFEIDDLSDFYIHNGTIVVDGENCLLKAQKFERLDMYTRFRLREFRSFLNDYGRVVFGLSNTKIGIFRSTNLPQLFEGSIKDSLPIALVLNREFELGIRGIYAYLRYGEGIGLQGSVIGDDVKLTEFVLSPVTTMNVYGPTRKYVENGFISGTLSGGTLKGTWSNKDRSQTHKLSASIR